MDFTTQMRIYFIHGDMDFGKTMACHKLREKLLEKGFTEISHGSLKWPNDFYSIFKINGKAVGIYSAGDAASILRDGLNFGLTNKCDILINPIRTNIKYNKPLQECLKPDKDVWEWIEVKSFDTDEERIKNEETLAKKLLEIIC